MNTESTVGLSDYSDYTQHKFFFLVILPWMLMPTDPFLTQPSISQYHPRDLKNPFFKLSIFQHSYYFLPEFILCPFSFILIFLKTYIEYMFCSDIDFLLYSKPTKRSSFWHSVQINFNIFLNK